MRAFQSTYIGRHDFPKTLPDFSLRQWFTLDARDRRAIRKAFRSRQWIGGDRLGLYISGGPSNNGDCASLIRLSNSSSPNMSVPVQTRPFLGVGWSRPRASGCIGVRGHSTPSCNYASCPRCRSIRRTPRSSRLAAVHDRMERARVYQGPSFPPTRRRHDSPGMGATAARSAVDEDATRVVR